jgi:hypothetical protein
VRLDGALTEKLHLFLRAGRDYDDTQSPFRVGPGLGGYVFYGETISEPRNLSKVSSARSVKRWPGPRTHAKRLP